MEYTGQNQGRKEETHHPSHRFRRLFLTLYSRFIHHQITYYSQLRMVGAAFNE